MDIKNIKIRKANVDDASQLLEIYAHYVKNTAITFEVEKPTIDDFANRIKTFSEKYPYLVAECENKILGYTYAHRFRERAAFAWAVETSIYLDKNNTKLGIGSLLYNELENQLKAMKITNAYACVTQIDSTNRFLDDTSIKFHEKMGYKIVGKLTNCGYKFHYWYNMLYMEKFIGKHRLVM